jgi:NAD(P)-dependent dehydrogenase (short-subunit alcohol dehydrogenase family)
MNEFKGKTAVVTGAGSGIGMGLATRCAREGMRVALADLHEGRLNTLRARLEDEGAEVLTCAVDVSDSSGVTAFARQCEEAFGVPDLLFNNAGILRVGEAWSHSPDEWMTMLSINVMGVVNGISAFVPAMIEADKPAHVVNTGSVGSLVSAPGMAQYTAAKMAVRGISESLAFDLAAREAKVGVSLLCPGPVLTSISDDLMGVAATDQVVAPEDHMLAGQPDFITPDDVAQCVFDAISQERFWIFTHPLNRYLETMNSAIVEGRNPEYREVVFDANL